MPNYFTRVELHDATSNDYNQLHAAMKARGFYRAIIGHSGTKRALPTATYHKIALTGLVIAVRDQATEAANTTGCKSTVLSVEAANWAGHFG